VFGCDRPLDGLYGVWFIVHGDHVLSDESLKRVSDNGMRDLVGSGRASFARANDER
jgi:formate-dependent phosphoribosylglycinamide formyltransferase (GAR transformylase)